MIADSLEAAAFQRTPRPPLFSEAGPERGLP